MYHKRVNSPAPIWALIIALPFGIGIVEQIFPVYFYRQFGLFYAVVFLVLGLFVISALNPRASKPVKAQTNTSQVYLWGFLWFMIALFLGTYYPEHQIMGFSGGYLYYLVTIIFSIVAFFIGERVSRVLPHHIVARIISLVPILLLVVQNWHLYRMNLSWSQAVAMTKIADGSLLDWNGISVVAALCTLVVIPLFSHPNKVDRLFAIPSMLSIVTLVVLAASRTSLTIFLIVLIFSFYRTKTNTRLWLIVLGIPLLFVFIFFLNQLPDLLGKLTTKTDDYWHNLYYVRYEMITASSLSEWWRNSNLFWFGDGRSWGHNHIVTVAVKGGIGSLLIYLFLQTSIFRAAWKSQNEFRSDAILLFALVFSANLIGDFIFTVPYYAFLSMFLIGWLLTCSTNPQTIAYEESLHLSNHRSHTHIYQTKLRN